MEPILSVKGISKVFPGVKALTDVSIDFYPGEVHALVGENGAGKSTLIKIISGVIHRRRGLLFLKEKKPPLPIPVRRSMPALPSSTRNSASQKT